MNWKSLSNPQKWIILGIPVLFFIGTIVHFLYDLCGQNPVVGLFAPINESVWEHLKLGLLPLILWWTLYYFIRGKKYNIDANKWFAGALAALIVSIISVPLMFYFYTQAFGVELLWVDITIFLLSLIFGQLAGLHFYKYSKGIDYKWVLLIFIIIIAIFMIFTYFPPDLPIFISA